jgi:hypothetical protein
MHFYAEVFYVYCFEEKKKKLIQHPIGAIRAILELRKKIFSVFNEILGKK